MSGVTDDIAADFLVEAGEIIQKVGDQLVQLEQAPRDKDLLNTIFRGFHTVKGGAGFMGLVPMVNLCHAIEDTFDAARNGKIVLNQASFDATQQGLDLVTEMLQDVAAGQNLEPAPKQLLDTLHAAAKGLLSSTQTEKIEDANAIAKPTILAKSIATPIEAETTIRIDTKRLDSIVNQVGELVLARNRLKVLREKFDDEALDRAISALDLATGRLQGSVMKTRMQPVSKVFGRFPKLARDVARSLNKEVDLVITGADTELDRKLVDALADPLVHLVRNAIDHGIELPAIRTKNGKPSKGTVTLSAWQEGDNVTIEIRDDGAGMDAERLRAKAIEKGLLTNDAASRLTQEECWQIVFLPGFSTKSEVTDISGRGVGMDVVQSRIRELNGQIQISSELGSGSRFTIRVPLTSAILPTLLVRVRQEVYALPLSRIEEVIAFSAHTQNYIDSRPVLDRREKTLPLVWLRSWLGEDNCVDYDGVIVVLQSGDFRYGLIVDEVRGREEVVIKALPKRLRGLPGYAGATLIGDGSLSMILDVDGLYRSACESSQRSSKH